MAFLHEEKDDYNHKDEKESMVQRTDTHQNLKRHMYPTGEFVIVAKFGGRA